MISCKKSPKKSKEILETKGVRRCIVRYVHGFVELSCHRHVGHRECPSHRFTKLSHVILLSYLFHLLHGVLCLKMDTTMLDASDGEYEYEYGSETEVSSST